MDRWACRHCNSKLPDDLTRISDINRARIKCHYCGLREGEILAVDAPYTLDRSLESKLVTIRITGLITVSEKTENMLNQLKSQISNIILSQFPEFTTVEEVPEVTIQIVR